MITFSPASAFRQILRTLRSPSTLLEIALVVSMVYALALFALQSDPRTAVERTPSHTTVLTSLLLGSTDTADTYLVAPSKRYISRRTVSQKSWRESESPQLVGDDQFTLRTAEGTSVLRTSSTANFVIPSSKDALLTSITRSDHYELSTNVQKGELVLRIRHVPCDLTTTVPLGVSITHARPPAPNDPLPLQQRILRISPFETSAVILDSALSPHITIVNLFTHTTVTIAVPAFSPQQRHFSPTFLDEDTLLFSVLDGDRTGTVIYRIPENRASVLSDTFTDRAFVSMTGDIVLLQSFYDTGTMNVPFGSLAFYTTKHTDGVDSSRLEPVIGQGARAQDLRSQFFIDPNAAQLYFKDTLSETDFQSIRNEDMRTFLFALWRDQHFMNGVPQGQQRILKGPLDNLQIVGSIPFVVDAGKATFQWKTGISPLLQALDVPQKLITEYERRSLKFAEKGQTYELIDALW
ncbi:MAG: hypothetical protein WCG83_03905 [Candidatus Peregrinibacteria bacterium]